MKCYITSIGEPTTDLCIFSVERQGFEAVLVQDKTSFNAKLEFIYNDADDDFLRIDADVIMNHNVHRFIASCPPEIWWLQSMSFDWWQMDTCWGGVQYIKKKCLPALRANISKVQHLDRPESLMYRLPEFHEPRRCEGAEIVCGLHGYGQNDMQRVIDLKTKRKQIDSYDFKLAQRASEL